MINNFILFIGFINTNNKKNILKIIFNFLKYYPKKKFKKNIKKKY